jgi:prephenate dehydratase
MFPVAEVVPTKTFEDVFEAVRTGVVERGVVYIENSTIGRIADIHRLLPESDLHIVKEYFLPVHHQLMALPGATLSDIKVVMSQGPALSQCRSAIKVLGAEARDAYDTAGSAKLVAEGNDKTIAAIAPRLAAEIYGLKILKEDIEDVKGNTTRCIALAKELLVPEQGTTSVTTFIFRVKSVPAALYKALGCFATNGINLTKIESYQLDGSFLSVQFYVDVEAHVEDENLKAAFRELEHYTSHLKIIGCYPRDRHMNEGKE